MTAILTIECRGSLPKNYVPYICAPLPELGNGYRLHGPTLTRLAPRHWGLRVLLRGVNASLDTSTWQTGIRSLETHAFITGDDFQPAPRPLKWEYTLEPTAAVSDTEIYYYSGWPAVTLQVHPHAATVREVPMRAWGQGRRPGETVWVAALPTDQLGKDWGFLPHHGDQWDRPPYRDMYRPLGSCIHLADGEIFASPPPNHRSGPRIETIELPARKMKHTFIVHVVLPRDYDTTQQTYPLVVLNDGQNQLTNHGMHGGWHTDSTADYLIRTGRMRDAILVAVEMHPDRNRAYLPRGDALAAQGQADAYTELLATTLLDMLQSSYRIVRDPATTVIIGSSNGAIHALFAGLACPQAFGRVGCLSYAIMQPERNQRAIKRLTQLPFQRIYLDSGTRWHDGAEEEKDSDYTMITYGLRDLLLQRGLVLEQNLLYVLGYGDAHNEFAWRRRIAGCLEFLLPPL